MPVAIYRAFRDHGVIATGMIYQGDDFSNDAGTSLLGKYFTVVVAESVGGLFSGAFLAEFSAIAKAQKPRISMLDQWNGAFA